MTTATATATDTDTDTAKFPDALHDAYDSINDAGQIAALLTDPKFHFEGDDIELREWLIAHPDAPGVHRCAGGKRLTTAQILSAHTAAATDLTIWAVTCPGDPYEDRPSHFISADAHEAITSYADCYRGGVTRGVEAEEVDLEELACESAAAGDDAQARDCWSARAGDQAAIRRVCLALG